jgi:hypothetical protein
VRRSTGSINQLSVDGDVSVMVLKLCAKACGSHVQADGASDEAGDGAP